MKQTGKPPAKSLRIYANFEYHWRLAIVESSSLTEKTPIISSLENNRGVKSTELKVLLGEETE